MSTLIDALATLDCPDFDSSLIAWLNTLKDNQVALCEAIDNFNPASISFLTTPVYILNVARQRSAGTFDSGTVTVNLASVSGISVPTGAKAVMLRCFSGVNGQNDSGGGSPSLFSYSHIEVARLASQINGGSFFGGMAVTTQVTYADTNLLGCDNDDTNDVNVEMNGTSFAYRAKCRFDDTFGIDVGTAKIAVVGFIS